MTSCAFFQVAISNSRFGLSPASSAMYRNRLHWSRYSCKLCGESGPSRCTNPRYSSKASSVAPARETERPPATLGSAADWCDKSEHLWTWAVGADLLPRRATAPAECQIRLLQPY